MTMSESSSHQPYGCVTLDARISRQNDVHLNVLLAFLTHLLVLRLIIPTSVSLDCIDADGGGLSSLVILESLATILNHDHKHFRRLAVLEAPLHHRTQLLLDISDRLHLTDQSSRPTDDDAVEPRQTSQEGAISMRLTAYLSNQKTCMWWGYTGLTQAAAAPRRSIFKLCVPSQPPSILLPG